MNHSKAELKREILRYVERHPRSAETPEGIARWWLSRQRLEEAIDAVRAALDELVSEGKLERHVITGGTPVYRAPQG
jgi:hypothetical protein